MSASAGVTVSATTIEESTASVYAMASGRKNAPVRPWRKKIGTAAAMMMSVA